ncbi:MAG: hypothetical protein AABZ30_05475 [Myxococcota bacterium]
MHHPVRRDVRAALAPLLACACGALGEQPFPERRNPTGVAPWSDLGPVEFCLGEVRVAPASASELGVCVPDDAPAPPACETDADCASRERCLCGRCTATACATDGDCGADMVCDLGQRYPRCARRCTAEAQCAAGEICQSERCRQGCDVDAECQHGEVCSFTFHVCITAHCPEVACLPTESCRPQRTPLALRGPSVLPHDGGLLLYAAAQDGIRRAVGASGTSFRLDPIEPVADGRAPSAIATDSGVTLLFERDGALWRAESDDGKTFGQAALALAADLRWEGGALAAPAAALDGEELLLAYAAASGAGIGLARGPIGGDLAKQDAPLLAPADVEDPLLWRGVATIGDPALLVVPGGPAGRGPILRIYFSALGTESSSSVELGQPRRPSPNASIGYAAAELAAPRPSVYAWNPVFDRTVAFLEHLEERAPAVVFHDGRYLLYYDAGEANIGVAVNPPIVPGE